MAMAVSWPHTIVRRRFSPEMTLIWKMKTVFPLYSTSKRFFQVQYFILTPWPHINPNINQKGKIWCFPFQVLIISCMPCNTKEHHMCPLEYVINIMYFPSTHKTDIKPWISQLKQYPNNPPFVFISIEKNEAEQIKRFFPKHVWLLYTCWH